MNFFRFSLYCPRIFAALLALGTVGIGQQNPTPFVHQRGLISVRVEDGKYIARNARTGVVLASRALKVTPGDAPKPGTGYQFQTLEAPAGAISSYAGDISGTQIVGGFTDSANNSYGLLFSYGKLQVLGYPGESQTNFQGINAEGTIVGDYSDGGSVAYGLRYKDGEFTSISNGTSSFTILSGINDSGATVGEYVAQGYSEYIGFMLAHGVRTQIVVPGAYYTFPTGITESGEIVGYYDGPAGMVSFNDTNGTFTTIQVPGSTITLLEAISDNGQFMAGSYYDNHDNLHGFVLSSGQFTTIDYPGTSTYTVVLGIENSGRIVGGYSGPLCPLPQGCAFLATPK